MTSCNVRQAVGFYSYKRGDCPCTLSYELPGSPGRGTPPVVRTHGGGPAAGRVT